MTAAVGMLVIIRVHQSIMYADVAYCTEGIVWSVCWSVTVMNSAKMTEPINLPFRLWIQVGSRNHVLNGDPDLPWEGAIFEGRRGSPL